MKSSLVLLSIAAVTFFSSCQKEQSFENPGVTTPTGNDTGSVSGTSVFRFDGGSGNCTGALLDGIITAGTALTAANTVTIQVNVDSIGTYSITTSTADGISFSGSGTFINTGAQEITLTGTGTPSAAGTFTIAIGNGGCTFSVVVLPAVVTPPGGFGTFTVKLNDTLKTFNILQATLIRSVATSEKRFDIAGVSTDGLYRLIITIGDSSAVGNNVGTGNQPVRLFLEDDLATPEDESEDSYAFYTLSTSLGNNNWLTDVYRENGMINISANAPAATTGTITATFSGTLNDFTDPALTRFALTEGVFTNITYMVLN